jgi:hypothetical protein
MVRCLPIKMNHPAPLRQRFLRLKIAAVDLTESPVPLFASAGGDLLQECPAHRGVFCCIHVGFI